MSEDVGTGRFRASSRDDLKALEALTRLHVRGDKRIPFAVMVMDSGLIRPRGKIRVALGFMKGVARIGRMFGRGGPVPIEVAFWAQMDRREPAELQNVVDSTLAHMVGGRDTEDADSVGGWSQRELDAFVGILQPMLPPGSVAAGPRRGNA